MAEYSEGRNFQWRRGRSMTPPRSRSPPARGFLEFSSEPGAVYAPLPRPQPAVNTRLSRNTGQNSVASTHVATGPSVPRNRRERRTRRMRRTRRFRRERQ